MLSSHRRRGQIHSSTIFALTLAILAGLIGAFLFKSYFMNGKEKPAAAPEAFEITVAAANLTDKTLILPSHVKKLKVSKERFEGLVRNPQYLHDAQPVGRTTKTSVKAEEPITEDMVESLAYPDPVSLKLKPGKRAVIVEVPSKSAMIQVGDYVDLLATITNDRFNNGQMATAVLARNARVVARFNTTRTAALPNPTDPNRTYTLEVTPYRHALLELARQMGAAFTLSVSAKTLEEAGVVRDMGMDDDPQAERVTSEDLARIFGIPSVAGPDVITIDRISGVNPKDPLYFNTGPDRAPPVKASSSPPPNRLPTGTPGTSAPRPPNTTPSGSSSQLPRNSGVSFVSANTAPDRNFGFRPLAGGANCGKPTG
jgi:Flp pilus assembly protein CpaB